LSNEIKPFNPLPLKSLIKKFSNKDNQLILNKSFFLQPYEIILRSLSESIKSIGKKYYSARGKKLDKIINDLNNIHPYRATLGGCMIEKVNQTVIITKEG